MPKRAIITATSAVPQRKVTAATVSGALASFLFDLVDYFYPWVPDSLEPLLVAAAIFAAGYYFRDSIVVVAPDGTLIGQGK